MNTTVEQLTDAGQLPILHRYGGKVYASGLFQLYDQEGIHPTDSVAMCRQRGWVPCLSDFRACALRAGWKREKIDAILAEVPADSPTKEQ